MLLQARALSPAERCKRCALAALWSCIDRVCNAEPGLRDHPEQPESAARCRATGHTIALNLRGLTSLVPKLAARSARLATRDIDALSTMQNDGHSRGHRSAHAL